MFEAQTRKDLNNGLLKQTASQHNLIDMVFRTPCGIDDDIYDIMLIYTFTMCNNTFTIFVLLIFVLQVMKLVCIGGK